MLFKPIILIYNMLDIISDDRRQVMAKAHLAWQRELKS
jgi:hypothetical protein